MMMPSAGASLGSSSASMAGSQPLLLTRLRATERHCFAALPSGTFLQARQARDPNASGCMVLLLEWSDSAPNAAAAASGASSAPAASPAPSMQRRVYVGWQGDYLPASEDGPASSEGMGCIGLPTVFAQSLGIPAGLRVRVTLLPDLPLATSSSAGGGTMVVLEPCTPDDWEILELNAGAVEMGLLAQAQVLNPGQIFPFWLAGGGGTRIALKYTPAPSKGVQAPFAKLTLNSEVSIVPKPRPSKRAPQPEAPLDGPPPPIACLRVQPRQAAGVREELARQREAAAAAVTRAKDAQRESRYKEWEAIQAAAGAFDLSRALRPEPAFTAAGPPIPSPTCTLASPHYVHVSSATMRFLGANNDDLVVLTCAASQTKRTQPTPLMPPHAQQQQPETFTTVLRVAQASCVFEGVTDSTSYLSSAPHHILLPPSLRLAFGIVDFAWVHLQRLTGHSAAPQGASASALKQALCVRESLQRLQNIRLREIEVQCVRRADHTQPSQQHQSQQPPSSRSTAASRTHQALEDDARLVSDAFIAYVRASRTSSLDSPIAATEPLAVPFINGAIVALDVLPVTAAGRSPSSAVQASSRKRFFSVHFNEPDLLAAAALAKRGALALATGGAPPTPLSLLDMSPPASTDDAPLVHAVQGGLKVSMATSYFLVRAPAADVQSAGTKKKGTGPPPLPLPVLHANKQSMDLVLDPFEDAWEEGGEIESKDQDSFSASASSHPHPHPSFDRLGGGPAYHTKVVAPVVRFLRSTLCASEIGARGAALNHRPEVASSGATGHIGGLMLVGSSGKSALLWALCRALRSPPTSNDAPAADVSIGVLASTQWVDCKLHVSARVSAFRALFSSLLTRALHSAPGPSVVVLEDLDKLLPLATGENDGGAGMRATQLAEAMLDTLASFQARHPSLPLAVIATAASANSHHTLCNLLFPTVVELPSPGAADRVAIIQALLEAAQATLAPKVDRLLLGKRTEGYKVTDLQQLVGRVTQAADRRTQLAMAATALTSTSTSTALVPTANSNTTSSRMVRVDETDLTTAFRNFVPSSLKSLSSDQLASSGDAAKDDAADGWASVGGMLEPKSTLLETFELPVRYAELFALAPLKLRSGLLLYGPSGCGKTMLASNIAKRCGLAFITVKGPEMLDKYIGSSESNVRDIFARARAAAPALLFFDEMDSIVPARGSGSGGVTDRVVNQFLCELDGVDGKLAGERNAPLYVLGATSRPDLIDPALLRPGRLDKTVYCGLPTETERSDMLKCMTRKLQLAADVDLEVLAKRTEEYTPADLQAIVTNAQLEIVTQTVAQAQAGLDAAKAAAAAVSSSSDAPIPSPSPAALVLPPLTQAHLLAALVESRPSTSPADRAKGERIYSKFRLAREDGKGPDPTGDVDWDPSKPQQQMLA